MDPEDLSFDAKLDSSTDYSLLGNPNQNPAYDGQKLAPVPDPGVPSIINSFSGLLSKSADTFLDVFATAGANKIVGSVTPTGQVSPGTAAAQAAAAKKTAATNANQVAMNYTPLIYIGVGLVALLVVVKIVQK